MRTRISTGEISEADEALEASGQSYGALKRSTDWAALRTVFPPEFLSGAERVPYPAESDLCFIVCQGERRGPYLPEQMRTMWKNGSITADAGVVWDDIVEPVPISTLIVQSEQTRSSMSCTAPVSAGGTALAAISIICGVIGMVILALPMGIVALLCGIPAVAMGSKSGIVGIILGIIEIAAGIGLISVLSR